MQGAERTERPMTAALAIFGLLAAFSFSGVATAWGLMPGAEKAPPSVIQNVVSGQPQDIIVLFDDSAIESQSTALRATIGAKYDTPKILSFKKVAYHNLKQKILDLFLPGGEETLIDYDYLPMTFMRVNDENALAELLGHSEVVKVYENGVKYAIAAPPNLQLINQPQVASLGMTGGGTAVAVLDTGVNYTRSAFGSCTGPNAPGDCLDLPSAPAGCSVACVHDFAASDGSLDDDGHGTNVSGIVVGVAPDTKVIGLDVFQTNGYAYDSDIINAINWSIANKAVYNIVAMNLSLGDSSVNASPCSGNTFATPITSAKSAGILAAIASGNDGYTNAISSPACVPGAVSVGAVYSADWGSRSWSLGGGQSCQDSTTYADKITCFSNSASYLTILAPGSIITAAGISMSGTSQATPHIAGAIAVLEGQNAFPSDTADQIVTRMTSTGTPVTDTRSGANGRVTPRIDLLAAAGGGGTTYAISGTITSANGPMQGVTVTLTGAADKTTSSDTNGNYSFTGLDNGAYTVAPSAQGYTFSPPTRSITIAGADVSGADFTGAPVPTYSISGTIRYGLRYLPGVTVTLTGSGSGSAVTDYYGRYSIAGLVNGTYTVTPTKTGDSFTPSSRTVTVNGANVAGQDFSAIAGGGGGSTYSISGTVRYGAGYLSGVTVTLTGSGSGSTVTNYYGRYTITGLTNGTYTVTPTKTGYSFSPASLTVSVNGANVVGQDFSGIPDGGGGTTYSISGTVRYGVRYFPGVTMTLGGDGSGSVVTDPYGRYKFPGLANGAYTVTPSKAGYSFTPSSRELTVSGSSVAGQNFTGVRAP